MALPPSPLGHGGEPVFAESWVWDTKNKSPDVELSSNKTAAYFHIDPVDGSIGTAAVRGTKSFTSGEHYWEVVLTEPPMGTSVMVGVCTEKASLHTSEYNFVNLIGIDEHGWGLCYKGTVWHKGQSHQYCQPFYKTGTVIGVHLNLYSGSLTFFVNGVSQGVAFTGLNEHTAGVYPIISSTAMCTEMELGPRLCSYLSLEDECYLAITKALKRKADAQYLPIPTLIKRHIMDIK